MSASLCPAGYVPIPGDASNCTNSTQTTIVPRTCPAGLTLQGNGLCGTGSPTIIQTAALYCGPQYASKNCVYTAQVTSALTPATGNEAIPNTICAFTEADIQTPCDPGCCTGKPPKTPAQKEEAAASKFPLWAILLLIGIGVMFLTIVVYFATRKKKLNNISNGSNKLPNGNRLRTNSYPGN